VAFSYAVYQDLSLFIQLNLENATKLLYMCMYVRMLSVVQKAGWVPLYSSFESFYNRNIYRRIRDCWNRPIGSAPAAEFDLVERVTSDHGWTFT